MGWAETLGDPDGEVEGPVDGSDEGPRKRRNKAIVSRDEDALSETHGSGIQM